jgi:hypothetical protein
MHFKPVMGLAVRQTVIHVLLCIIIDYMNADFSVHSTEVLWMPDLKI